jgi:hypothetical protein
MGGVAGAAQPGIDQRQPGDRDGNQQDADQTEKSGGVKRGGGVQ